MLDRASTFARPGIVELLQSRFIPVALDQAYQRRQKDAEGEFYRQIAGQGPRSDFGETTQGFYIAAADGRLLYYNNSRDPEKLERVMREKLRELAESKPDPESIAALKPGTPDPRWNVSPPDGGLVVRVQAKVMGGYEPTDDRWKAIFQSAISRDNLWITGAEHQELARGSFPPSLVQRIARFHLVDNTRGEPPMWQQDEVRATSIKLENGLLTGTVKLRTRNGDRSFDAGLRGRVEATDGVVTRFDLVAFGDFSGRGPYTPNPPPGPFPLAITLTLADGRDLADALPPQGARGWVEGYLKMER